MLTLRKIRNVRADLRGPMTFGQIADLHRITGIELFVIRYSPRPANGRVIARMQTASAMPTATEARRQMRAWRWSCK
jgi:hypothetical protein